MATASTPTAVSHRREHRQHLRVCFPPSRRPRLQLGDGEYAVLDASLGGLRIRHFGAVRPDFGERVVGTLHFVDGHPPAPLQGTVVRVQAADVAIVCPEGVVPVAWLLEEIARARDAVEDGPNRTATGTQH